MDELEISGKRYISTRRAAKQYGYHSDYIGQLIRGKKLIASKVGRSWYVELDSLAEYFGKEGGSVPKVVGIVAKSVAPTPVAPVAALPTEVEEIISSGVVDEDMQETSVEKEQIARDSIHIPVRLHRPSFEVPVQKKVMPLRYVNDDEPYMPAHRHAVYGQLSATTVMPRSVEEVEDRMDAYEEEYVAPPVRKEKVRRNFMPVFTVAAVGIVALVVAMGGSIVLSSQTVVEAGKAASVGYTLQ